MTQATLATSPNKDTNSELVQLRLHPRVFSALGKDLVTNDVVAVIELVKNAYDAFAQNVWIEFSQDKAHGPCLEIRDDGSGMTREIIENVWCLVATPYRERNPVVNKGGRTRRVVGAKGLGRLSVARLGRSLVMTTQALDSQCWEVTVDWSALAAKDDLTESTVICKEYAEKSPFVESGTRLKILGLEGEWDEDNIDDLKENLARLISPFSEVEDFSIFLAAEGSEHVDGVRIESSRFLSQPKYLIRGDVRRSGKIKASYTFSPITAVQKSRNRELNSSWYHVREAIPDSQRPRFPENKPDCGPFSFEIRAWDIGAEDTREISDKYGIQRSLVRRAIRAHKGISVYRDGVLVLPKSDNARDWLGLDLRRVGRVGPRLSTSQIVGYVAISADNNPGIVDTSDRERLSSSKEVATFEEFLKAIVRMLEVERASDRSTPTRERTDAGSLHRTVHGRICIRL